MIRLFSEHSASNRSPFELHLPILKVQWPHPIFLVHNQHAHWIHPLVTVCLFLEPVTGHLLVGCRNPPFFFRISHSWCINTYNCSICIPLQWQTHRDDDDLITNWCWVLFKELGDRAFIAKPTPASLCSFSSLPLHSRRRYIHNPPCGHSKQAFTKRSYIYLVLVPAQFFSNQSDLSLRSIWSWSIHQCSYIPFCKKKFSLYPSPIYAVIQSMRWSAQTLLTRASFDPLSNVFLLTILHRSCMQAMWESGVWSKTSSWWARLTLSAAQEVGQQAGTCRDVLSFLRAAATDWETILSNPISIGCCTFLSGSAHHKLSRQRLTWDRWYRATWLLVASDDYHLTWQGMLILLAHNNPIFIETYHFQGCALLLAMVMLTVTPTSSAPPPASPAFPSVAMKETKRIVVSCSIVPMGSVSCRVWGDTNAIQEVYASGTSALSSALVVSEDVGYIGCALT